MTDKDLLLKNILKDQLEDVDKILNILKTGGKREKDALNLLFFFISTEKSKLDKLARQLLSLGFVDEYLYKSDGEYSLNIEYHTSFSKSNVVEVITKLGFLCAELGVEFDGWEAEI